LQRASIRYIGWADSLANKKLDFGAISPPSAA